MPIGHRASDERQDQADLRLLDGAAAPLAASKSLEIELKLLVPESARQALEQRLMAYGPGREQQIDSVYFDTKDRTLAAQKAALRLRRVGDGSGARWVQTLKTGHTDAALARRDEWEAFVAGPRLALSRLPASALEPLLSGAKPKLAPVFHTRFARSVREARIGQALIELAFDRGLIVAGRQREPICELELELKHGDAASVLAVYDLARQLIGKGKQAIALLPCVYSKAARGYRLADSLVQRPTEAGADGFAAVLDSQMNSGQAARRIVEHVANLVLANIGGAARSENLEFVHQSRIALRRGRSALRLLGVAGGPKDPVARDLHWLADRFGKVRDWDVLVTERLPALGAEIGMTGHPAWMRLLNRADKRRQRCLEGLRRVTSTPRFASLVIRLLRWTQTPSGGGPRLQALAPMALRRGHRRVLATGEDLKKMSARGRHRLRILAKRQRYAIELLEDLLNQGDRPRLLKSLARLQQALGEINDEQVLMSWIPKLTSSRQILERANRWGRRQIRRQLPKAAASLRRLKRERFDP
jgi:triphosphatase